MIVIALNEASANYDAWNHSGSSDADKSEADAVAEIRAFAEMAKARGLNPATEILRAIEARHDTMLAE